MAVPNSAMVRAPVQARIPPRSQMSSPAPGEGTLASMGPGEEKTPEPITMLIRSANPSIALRLRANVPRGSAASVSSWRAVLTDTLSS
jgi:hypothetical protein